MSGIAQKISNSTGADDIENNISYPLIGNGTLPFQSFNGSSISSNGIWSTHGDDTSYYQLQKFWCELTPQARQSLLRIDKQTLFEHARKNMYCSRCNGLLLEGFLQLVMYGKSLQPDPAGGHNSLRSMESPNVGDLFGLNNCEDDAPDPSVHPWGGLTATRDGTLTLLDCYLYSKSLTSLQNVFDSARSRDRERELLYPDACGGGARGWISQGNAGYGRGHGTRETCALHTAKLSVETLVDFWSALGEETHQSLLRMKEEDFIERLMYRFDSKRFCRDCRRNVIREFKELKELKRLRRETRCTSCFCVADTAFEYEVSHDTVQADWHQTFSDNIGAYHHFEWAIGTGEGKTDILEFENVGLSRKVQVNGLDLSGLNTCHITVRAWKIDGRCNELCVKAHALRGQLCVHCRLVVGDGIVTITRGESISTFFEHAEEAEEEEDDDFMDKEGNELDGECSRPQKHAKSPELAREFLLDAATIIFKEQVEKAFRDGTARQNAHSIFVCLALKLLEERVHIACKEIITYEKQIKLLEEEEKEKRQEEERKERRRTKEREKKLRRKERLRGRKSQESKGAESNSDFVVPDALKAESNECSDEGVNAVGSRDSASETGETTPSSPFSPEHQANILSDEISSNIENSSEGILEGDYGDTRDWSKSFHYDSVRCSRTKLKFCKNSPRDLNLKFVGRREGASLSETRVFDSKYECRYHTDGIEPTRCNNGFNKQVRANIAKSYSRNGSGKLNEKFQCTNNRSSDRYDSQACNCNHHHGYRSRPEYITRIVQDPKYANKLETPSDISKPFYRGNKYVQSEYRREINGQAKSKVITGNSPIAKKVWEPLNSSKKCIRSNSDSDVTLRLVHNVEVSESGSTSSDEVTDVSVQTNQEDCDVKDSTSTSGNCTDVDSGFHAMDISKTYLEGLGGNGDSSPMPGSLPGASDASVRGSSNSDNFSSSHSEGDSNISNPQNLESASTSDSEEFSQISSIRAKLEHCLENGTIASHTVLEKQTTFRGQDSGKQGPRSAGMNFLGDSLEKSTSYGDNGIDEVSVGAHPQSLLPQSQKQNMNLPVFQAPPMDYYLQGQGTWSASPTNGLRSFPLASPYLFSNTYGYGLSRNPQFMQYRPLQQLAHTLLNHCHVPVFHPVTHVSGVGMTEPAKVVNPSALKEYQHIIQKVASIDRRPAIASTVGNAGQNGKPDKLDAGNNGFSLFHFGGPVALSTGVKEADPAYLREGMSGKTSVVSAVADCYSCNKKDSIEEYNLFDATNGIKFSIF